MKFKLLNLIGMLSGDKDVTNFPVLMQEKVRTLSPTGYCIPCQ